MQKNISTHAEEEKEGRGKGHLQKTCLSSKDSWHLHPPFEIL